MNLIAELEGLKFPDEMVTRFFFKNGLHRLKGRVLELGCGNCNNLTLFAAHGWTCSGLDISATLLDQGARNFEKLGFLSPRLEAADMNLTLPDFGPIDVLLLPSSLYYVSVDRAKSIIGEIAPTLSPGAQIFCRFRTPEDYRYGKGDLLGQDCFRLNIAETSEFGCINSFYSISDMLSVLDPFGIEKASLRVMKLVFDNLGVGDQMIRNDEIVLWGKKPVATNTF